MKNVKFYHIHMCTQVDIEIIKHVFNDFDDWYRYSEYSWIVISSMHSKEIYEKLKILLPGNNQCLILEINPHNYAGNMSVQFWNWIKSKKDSLPGLFKMAKESCDAAKKEN